MLEAESHSITVLRLSWTFEPKLLCFVQAGTLKKRRVQKHSISEIPVENDIRHYLGTNVFDGGCFFLNMLVELSGQSASMSKQILRGFVRLSSLLRSWLEEADQKDMLRAGLDFKEIANYIIITLNGAAALYISSRDRTILEQTIRQLHFYINQLKK